MATEPDNAVEIICIDCDGTGREQIPCGPDDTICEFCHGGCTLVVSPDEAKRMEEDGWRLCRV